MESKMATTKEQVLENLKAYIGRSWTMEDVIKCCEDYYGEKAVIVWYCNAEYDYEVCANQEDCGKFYIKDNRNGTMKEVWAG